MTRFIVFSGRTILIDVPLGGPTALATFEVTETTRIGFEVEDHDERISYEVLIGDFPLPEDVQPQEHRSRLEWPASACLDGASGVTPISLRDATTGSPWPAPTPWSNRASCLRSHTSACSMT